MQQRLGLLRRVRLAATLVLQAFRPRANREQPIGAHLQIVVERLQRLIVERVLRRLIAARPDQRFVRVGEAAATEIRHRISLAPDHVIEQPEALVLQRRADPKNVVVGADHPQRAIGLQDTAAFGEPGAAELIVGLKARELVPVLVHAIDNGVVRPQQIAIELQVVGRIGEDEIDAFRWNLCQFAEAIAPENTVGNQRFRGTLRGGARTAWATHGITNSLTNATTTNTTAAPNRRRSSAVNNLLTRRRLTRG